jgi:hypothetical protein
LLERSSFTCMIQLQFLFYDLAIFEHVEQQSGSIDVHREIWILWENLGIPQLKEWTMSIFSWKNKNVFSIQT